MLRIMALVLTSALWAQQGAPPAAPVDAVTAIIDAFRTHDIVALSDAHGNRQSQLFLEALVRDPRFPTVANDIVWESGNARYQDRVDRFVRGEPVAELALREVWTETTVANEIPVDETFFHTVREVNAKLPRAQQIRVLLGDPPIDWSAVRTRDDHSRWLAMRAPYPAALVQLEVLAKQRRALVVYGQLHFQRHNLMSNFVMDDWRMQTVVSLLERSTPARIFTVWQFSDEIAKLQPDVTTWPSPSLAKVKGTRLGAADIAQLMPTPGRMGMRDGRLVQVPEAEWRKLAIEDQLDAVLFLGRQSTLTTTTPSGARCTEPGYLEERLRRIALTGIPAVEADRARQLCQPQ
jgi:hypothetical protein